MFAPMDTKPEPNFNAEYMATLDLARQRRLTALSMRKRTPPMTYQEIGDVLGVTRERARQLINKALKELGA